MEMKTETIFSTSTKEYVSLSAILCSKNNNNVINNNDSKYLVISIATGMVKEMYIPLARSVLFNKNNKNIETVLIVDSTNHGDSERRELETWNSWDILIYDFYFAMIDIFKQKNIDIKNRLYAFGHSFGIFYLFTYIYKINLKKKKKKGGCCVLVCESLYPNTFLGIITHESIIQDFITDPNYENRLAIAAIKRKTEFESRSILYNKWKGNGIFTLWNDEVLNLYINHGFKQVEKGKDKITLKLPSKLESHHFATVINQNHLPHLSKINKNCKVTLIAAKNNVEYHTRSFFPQIKRLGEECETRKYVLSPPPFTHFLPFENFDYVSVVIFDNVNNNINNNNKHNSKL